MTFTEIIQQIKNGNISPIYFLHGLEPYFIDKISETVQKHALTDEERGFNEIIMYGRDSNVTNLIHAARQYPMGAGRQLIIVREAQSLDDIDMMESYFRNPQTSTILVVSYKKAIDKRTKNYITLSKQPLAVFFESKKLYDNQMNQWINDLAKEKGLIIEPRAAALLLEYLGADLEKVSQSIEKLTVAIGPNKNRIIVDDVANFIGISKDYTPFELQSAIINRDVMKANKIVKAFAAKKDNPIQVVVSALFGYFSKLLLYYYIPDKNNKSAVASALKINPFFVDDYKKGYQNYRGVKIPEIISLLREYDMKSKGFGNVSASGGDLLKELVFKIMH